jgi:hypothetical protein
MSNAALIANSGEARAGTRRRKWLRIGAIAALCLGIIGGGYLFYVFRSGEFWMSPGRVSYSNYARIHAGMTKVRVERVLGGPAGDYRRTPRRYGAFGPQLIRCEDLMFHISVPLHDDQEGVSERRAWKHWLGDGLMIEVEFNDKDIVTSTSSSTLSGPGPIVRFNALFTDAKAWLGF